MVKRIIKGCRVDVIGRGEKYRVYIDDANRLTATSVEEGFELAKAWIEDNLM